MNLYLYGRASPLNFVDPSGTQELRPEEAKALYEAGAQSIADEDIESQTTEYVEAVPVVPPPRESVSNLTDLTIAPGHPMWEFIRGNNERFVEQDSKLKAEKESSNPGTRLLHEVSKALLGADAELAKLESSRAPGEGEVASLIRYPFSFFTGIGAVAGIPHEIESAERRLFEAAEKRTPQGAQVAVGAAVAGAVAAGVAAAELVPGGAGAKAGARGGTTLYHGTDIDSAVSFLKGAPLDAATAAAKKVDGPAGFFLATHADDAAYFATRRGRGAILEYSFSDSAAQRLGGLPATPLGPLGKFGRFEGSEALVSVDMFEVFNDLRQAGEITVKPFRR